MSRHLADSVATDFGTPDGQNRTLPAEAGCLTIMPCPLPAQPEETHIKCVVQVLGKEALTSLAAYLGNFGSELFEQVLCCRHEQVTVQVLQLLAGAQRLQFLFFR